MTNEKGEDRSASTIEYDYNTAGQLLSESRKTDSDGDGVVDSFYELTVTYDASGNQLSRTSHRDDDADGIPERNYHSESEYNEKDELIHHFSGRDEDGDGHYERVNLTSYEVEDGNLVGILYEEDHGGDGLINVSQRVTRTYNPAGQMLTEHSAYDSGADGVIETVSDTQDTYDTAGNLLSSLFESDKGADGTIEITRTRTYTYNESNQVLTAHHQHETEGVLEESGHALNEYDDAGRLLRSYNESDTNGDGEPEVVETVENKFAADGSREMREEWFSGDWTEIRISVFDNADQLTDFEIFQDAFGSSTYFLQTSTYDHAGKVLLRVTQSGLEGEEPDRLETHTHTYTDQGQRLAYSFDQFDGEGVLLSSREDSYEHDGYENETRWILDWDFNGDGVIDLHNNKANTYIPCEPTE